MSTNFKEIITLIRQYIKCRSLIYNIFSFVHLGTSIKATNLIEDATQLKAYKILKRKYGRIADLTKNKLSGLAYADCAHKNYPIWIFWYQGFCEAPELVKLCYESVRKYFPEHTINLIDKNNLAKYVSLPTFVYEKLEKGIISFTHFSDIVRLALLTQQGGIWIDSTVFFTGTHLSQDIINSDLFLFRNLSGSTGLDGITSSWFIVASKESRIINSVYNMLLEYWNNENSVMMEYYIFHIFMMIAIEKNPEEWEKVLIRNNGYPHLLQFSFDKPFDINKYNEFKNLTNIHKLSNKFKPDIIHKGSFGEKFFLGEL